MKTYKVNKINFDDVYLSQSMEIECSDGMKREIDSFYVKEIPTAQTAEVMFRNGKIKIDLLKNVSNMITEKCISKLEKAFIIQANMRRFEL